MININHRSSCCLNTTEEQQSFSTAPHLVWVPERLGGFILFHTIVQYYCWDSQITDRQTDPLHFFLLRSVTKTEQLCPPICVFFYFYLSLLSILLFNLWIYPLYKTIYIGIFLYGFLAVCKFINGPVLWGHVAFFFGGGGLNYINLSWYIYKN